MDFKAFIQYKNTDFLILILSYSYIDLYEEGEGNFGKQKSNTYRVAFTRDKGELTKKREHNLKVSNCPNCGAPMKVSSHGICEYCNSLSFVELEKWKIFDITNLDEIYEE